jgi:hypothetical protein
VRIAAYWLCERVVFGLWVCAGWLARQATRLDRRAQAAHYRAESRLRREQHKRA